MTDLIAMQSAEPVIYGTTTHAELIRLKEGQSLDDAITEQRMDPAAFMPGVKLPRTVLKPEDQKPMGTTSFLPEGPKVSQ